MVTLATTGLNDGCHAARCGDIDAIAEGEECVAGKRERLLPGGLGDGDPNRLHAGHLACSDTGGRGRSTDDDGVGFHMLADPPEEAEGRDLVLRGLTRGDNLPLLEVGVDTGVERLGERSEGGGAEAELALRRGVDDQQSKRLLGSKRLERFRCKARRDDDLEEELGEALCERGRDLSVGSDDATEGRDGVCGEGAVVGLFDRRAAADAAGVGMLDDDDGGFVVLADSLERGVGIEEVVVGELFALHEPGAAEGGCRGGAKEGGGLVRILAVTEGCVLLERDKEPLRDNGIRRAAAAEVGGDGGVVGGGVGEGLERQLTPQLDGVGALLNGVGDAVVVGRPNDDGHIAEVLRGSAEHGRPTDVDLLDGLRLCHPSLRDGLGEGVEIHNDDIDRDDAVVCELHSMFRKVAPEEDATVDSRVERLDAAVEDLRKTRNLRDVGNGDSCSL